MLFSAHSKLQETAGDTPQPHPVTPAPAALAPTTDAHPSMVVRTDALPTASMMLSPELSPAGVAAGSLRKNTQRHPVVIRGSSKKRAPVLTGAGAKAKHPLFVAGAIFAALLVVLTVLAYTVPIGADGKALLTLGGNNSGQISLTTAKSSISGADIAAQAVTATAITQAGNSDYSAATTNSSGAYDSPYTGIIPSSVADAAHLNMFAPGNCTYWVNYRYHYLTGVWIPWLGNAYEWYQQAINYGWYTSSYPNPNGYSILVMGPYTMGNGALGHVALVEYINGNGTVHTSNWNWGPQNYGITTYMDVPYPMTGLHYIWV